MDTSQQSLSKIDFTTFILSIASAAYIGLGIVSPGMPAETSGQVNLELAKQNIDLLELIWDKTKGNRTPEEERLLEQLLFETRMRFVEIQRRSKS